MKTIQAASPPMTASAPAARTAAIANGARKKLEPLRTSPAPKAQATTNQTIQAGICGELTPRHWRPRATTCIGGTVASPSVDKCAREIPGVERSQVVELFTDPDQLHWNPELRCNRQRDPTLRGAIELCQDQTRHIDSL